MTHAQRHQVSRVVTARLQAEGEVMRVQPAARGASRRLAAPAVALEDAVAPAPVRVLLVLPGVAQRPDEEQEALPVPEIMSRGGAAGADGAVPERRAVERTPDGDSPPGPPAEAEGSDGC